MEALVPAETLERCLDVLSHAPAGLLTDIDGTISAIAPTPDEATIVLIAKDALTRLRDHLALVGVVTGRSAASGEALVGVPGLICVGNHGMEWSEGGQLHHHASAAVWSDAVRETLIEIGEAARRDGFDDGLLVEDKHLSGSVHYRLALDPVAARLALLAVAGEVAERRGLRITEGRLVVEIRPPVPISKGTALADLIASRGLRSIVFLGDDITDIDAFRAIRRLREETDLVGLRVGVVGPGTAPIVVDESDVTVPGVKACAALLVAIAERFEAAASDPAGSGAVGEAG